MADDTPPPDPNTPDSALGPLVNLLAPIATLATQSDGYRHLVENFNLTWTLPYQGAAFFAAGIVAGLVWYYRRAVGRGKRWALWWRDLMPWNRA